VIAAAMAGVGARLIGSLAASGEILLSGFLLAFLSWTIAQVLAGCAAYAEAMYPCFVEDEPGRQGDRGGRAGAMDLRPLSHQDGSVVLAPVAAAEYRARAQRPRVASPGWIVSLLDKSWSRLRRERDRRRALAELRALDSRALRDIGISRCDVEYLVGQGDRCE
jgi:uncharacterized protein YjiS (DUF1127 family)